jgi:hypothetical protein
MDRRVGSADGRMLEGESKRQGMPTEVSEWWEKERDGLDERKGSSSNSSPQLVPVRGTRKRTGSWYIIDQRLIFQGLQNLLKERLWDNQCELSWVGRGERNKRGPVDGAA